MTGISSTNVDIHFTHVIQCQHQFEVFFTWSPGPDQQQLDKAGA